MTRVQFWIVTGTSVLASLLLFVQIIVGRQTRVADLKLMAVERLVQDGTGYNTRWQQLAVRTYQLSRQDPALKDLLDRQQIRISPKAAPTPPAATEPEAASPPEPSAPTK